MKKVIVIMLVLMLSLCGCSTLPENYQFENKDQKIISVELLRNKLYRTGGFEFILIRELDENEIDAFMAELYELPTEISITPPPTDFGPIVAKVSYENGDVEFFGAWHIELVKKGDKIANIGAYWFPDDNFENLFYKYAYSDTEENITNNDHATTNSQP